MLDLPPTLEGVLEAQIIEDTLYLTAREPITRAAACWPTRWMDRASSRWISRPLPTVTRSPELRFHYPGDASSQRKRR